MSQRDTPSDDAGSARKFNIEEQNGQLFARGAGSGKEWLTYDGPTAGDLGDF